MSHAVLPDSSTFPTPQPDVRASSGRRRRRIARAVGILVLGAFLVYGVGSAVATSSASSGVTAGVPYLAAVVAMLINSAMVASIGVIVFPVLRPHSAPAAITYVVTRAIEGIGLGIGAVSLLLLAAPDAVAANFVAYNSAMAVLGLGSIFFTAVLFRSRLVPRFLAAWGTIGYAAFATGSVLELAGVHGVGLLAVIPGGLFEVAFGIWLIARGFNPDAVTRVAPVSAHS